MQLCLWFTGTAAAAVNVAQSLSATAIELPYLTGGGPYTPVDITTSAFHGRDLILQVEQSQDIIAGETITIVLPSQFQFDSQLNGMAQIDATDIGGAFSLQVAGDTLQLLCETSIGGGGNIRFLALFACCDTTTAAAVPALPVQLIGTAEIDTTQAVAGLISAIPGPAAVFTAPQQDSTATCGGDGGYAFTCSGTLSDVLGATYSLYWSTNPALTSITAEAFAAVDLAGQPLINLPAGALEQAVLTAALEENEAAPYYLYAASSLTTQRSVGHSGWLRVYHFPEVLAVDPTTELHLDSGRLYNPLSAVPDGSGTPQVMLEFAAEDLDSVPEVSLFYGPAGITANAIVTSGSPPALTVVGLTGCEAITPAPLPVDLYQEYPWTVYSSASEWVTAGQYSVYAVAGDGRHAVLRESEAPVTVYHTPLIDLQTPPATTIDLGEDFCFTFNWGETVDGDRDADDDALIALYIDASDDSLADFSQATMDLLIDTLAATDGWLANGELMVQGIHEDPDQQPDNMYVWHPADLPSALANQIITHSGWLHFYAHIDDGVTGRLGSFEDGYDNFLAEDEPITSFRFQAAPNVMLVDPPPLGAAISAHASYLVRWVYAWNFGGEHQQLFLLLGDTGCELPEATWFDLTTSVPNLWVMNSQDGTIDQHLDTPAGDITTWEFLPNTMTGPSVGEGIPLEDAGDETYHVFLLVSSNPAGQEPDAADPVFTAPGTLAINGFGGNICYNLQMRPYRFDTFPGDTVTVSIYPQAGVITADMISLYVDVDTVAFDIVSLTSPFRLGPDFEEASILENDNHGGDLSNGRHHLDFTYFENGAPVPEFSDGTHLLCTLQLLPRRDPATGATIDNLVFAVDDEANRFTSFYQDGELLGTTIQSPAAISYTWSRGRVSGHVQLQGRDYNGLESTLILREPGSWLPVTDSLFNQNDIDPAAAGVQVQLGTDGTYQLHSVPDGCWELVASVPGWLSGYYPFDIQHGDLLEGVNPHFNSEDVDLLQLIAGDCAGYVDSSDTVLPDNQIDATDLNAIVEAYGSTPDSAGWNSYCDFDGDELVYITDLTLCTTNLNSSGVPPVYRRGHNATPVWQLERQPAGEYTTWTLVIAPASDLIGWSARLALPPGAVTDLQLCELFDTEAQSVIQTHGNRLLLAVARYGQSPGVSGELALARFTLPTGSGLPVLLLEGHSVDTAFRTTSGVVTAPPLAFELPPPWPNPFNSSLTIPLVVYETTSLRLAVYNILGQQVEVLYRDTIVPGSYQLQWRAESFAAGLYFLQAVTPEHRATRKVMHLQ